MGTQESRLKTRAWDMHVPKRRRHSVNGKSSMCARPEKATNALTNRKKLEEHEEQEDDGVAIPSRTRLRPTRTGKLQAKATKATLTVGHPEHREHEDISRTTASSKVS